MCEFPPVGARCSPSECTASVGGAADPRRGGEVPLRGTSKLHVELGRGLLFGLLGARSLFLGLVLVISLLLPR